MFPRSRGRRRALVLLGGGVFALSSGFPLIAGVGPALLPPWIGIADVGCAGVLLLLATVIGRAGRGAGADRVDYRVCRRAADVALLGLAVFLVVGDRIPWHVLLPGLVWRGWLLVQVLPAASRLWRNADVIDSAPTEDEAHETA